MENLGSHPLLVRHLLENSKGYMAPILPSLHRLWWDY
jgi:hypothetical protein